MKTLMTPPTQVIRKWHTLDANGQILGRLAVQAANLLRGRHRVDWSPQVDMGDGVTIINAAKIRVTGPSKMKLKTYQAYSGYPSGQKSESLEHLLQRQPTEVIRHAVRGMVPNTVVGRHALRRLRVFAEGPATTVKAKRNAKKD